MQQRGWRASKGVRLYTPTVVTRRLDEFKRAGKYEVNAALHHTPVDCGTLVGQSAFNRDHGSVMTSRPDKSIFRIMSFAALAVYPRAMSQSCISNSLGASMDSPVGPPANIV